MIYQKKESSIYLSTSFSEQAEKKLISNLFDMEYFQNPYISRRLATYPMASEEERDLIILEIMESLWSQNNAETFSIFKDFESVFKILGKRGHFIHQFEVFLLGCHLFEMLWENDTKNALKEFFTNHSNCFYSWLHTSTVHDFGYPLQEANKIAAKFSELYKKLNMETVSQNYSSIYQKNWIKKEQNLLNIRVHNSSKKNQETINIDQQILSGIQECVDADPSEVKSLLERLSSNDNHGYISAIIFFRNYLDFNDKKNDDYLKKISAAIALHALPMDDMYFFQRIDFYSNPLAYLLILIDNIQDWNRTLKPSQEWPSYSLEYFDSNVSSMQLIYNLEHQLWTNTMKDNVRISLNEKRELLQSLKPPKPSFNYPIKMIYKTSDGDDLGEISLTL
nr:hypothetical protein [uncultured Desulfobacter sp.]